MIYTPLDNRVLHPRGWDAGRHSLSPSAAGQLRQGEETGNQVEHQYTNPKSVDVNCECPLGGILCVFCFHADVP